ncbi:RNA polymerase-binding transcription factor DksA [hydrothermal vent metagenome]|uniref:RNA polymerase-binding transcription factor DksA n=1 Tax=hydrothermal vent metagenome TaxID=652676 RepID=A0A3B1C4J0_9ZZZZ
MPAKKTSTVKKKAVAKKKTAASKKKPAAKKVTAKKITPKKDSGKISTKKTTTKKAAVSQKKTATNSDPKSFEPYKLVKGEEYMNDAHVAHFNQLLLNWKHELMEEVDRTVHHMQDEAANFPDPNDRATQESEFTIELRTRDRERKLIKKIDEALDHLESGEYGYCEQCGLEIGIRRLEARPTATLCIDCKSLDEIRERQRG